MKKRKNWILAGLGIGSCILVGTLFTNPKSSKDQILVAAAASMKNVMDEIEDVYEEIYPDIDVVFTYGGSGTLQKQIEQGAPIDVFIAASKQHMQQLDDKGLIETTADLVENTMILIVPEDSPYTTLTFENCHQLVETIAIGEPESVPAGNYAKSIFDSLGTYGQIREKATLGLDVTQVLSWVQAGNVDAGVVYQTDFNLAKDVKRVDEAQELLDTPIIYPIGTTTASKVQENAQEFMRFCLSDVGQSLFEDYGFIRKDQ